MVSCQEGHTRLRAPTNMQSGAGSKWQQRGAAKQQPQLVGAERAWVGGLERESAGTGFTASTWLFLGFSGASGDTNSFGRAVQ